MASMNLDVAVKRDWLPANPWLWLGTGIALCVWSWAWTAVFRGNASDNRLFVLVFGLLFASIGVWLRYGNRSAVYVRAWMPPLALLLRVLVGVLFALLAIGLTGVFIGTFFYSDKIGLNPGATALIWLSVAPLSAGAARRCLKRTDNQDVLEPDEEVGLAFCLLAACCGLGILTLRNPDQPTDWDSLQLFLRVAAGVSLVGGALVLVSTGLRRLTLGFLFTVHFTGICSAALSAPPAPWAVQQVWIRIFRPYLEFMYLNNAYHFYAPDPSFSSYLWFRVIFTAPDGSEHGLWYKVPQLDEKGRIKHPVALEYQRYLSLTESVAAPQPLPSESYFDEETKQWVLRPIYVNRLNLLPMPGQALVVLGQAQTPHLRIPLHPDLLKTQQVHIPADMAQRLLESYARHVAEKFATYEDKPGELLKFKSVKVYRVVHAIPPIGWFMQKLPPNHPTLYRPYYLGNYGADGKQINEPDPYLYWMLPILPSGPHDDPETMINDFCRKHAGDSEWRCSPKDWH
jgi:hypothetical protein